MPKLILLSPDDPHYLLALLARIHQDRTFFAGWHARREWEGLGLDDQKG